MKNKKILLNVLIAICSFSMLSGCENVKCNEEIVGNEILLTYEEKLNIDLIDSTSVIYTTYTYKKENENIIHQSKVMIDYCSNDSIKDFEKQILSDDRFQNRLNNQLYVPSDFDCHKLYTYYLFYNNTTNSIVDDLLVDGTYEITQLAYVKELKYLYIYNYKITI